MVGDNGMLSNCIIDEKLEYWQLQLHTFAGIRDVK